MTQIWIAKPFFEALVYVLGQILGALKRKLPLRSIGNSRAFYRIMTSYANQILVDWNPAIFLLTFRPVGNCCR